MASNLLNLISQKHHLGEPPKPIISYQAPVQRKPLVPNLSNLPTKILLILCKKLDDIGDYIQFGAVCHPWRRVLWECRSSIPPQLPVLLLANTHSPATDWHDRSFIPFPSPDSDNIHKELPITRYEYQKCYGSSHGWLFTLGVNNSFQLFNPFLTDHNVIKLPFLDLNMTYIKKFVLSDNPIWTSNYIVMVSCDYDRLYYFKRGDKSWTPICFKDDELSSFQDVIYYNEHFYAVTLNGEVVRFDISSVPQPMAVKIASSPLNNIEYGSRRMYLVEYAGELLCVVRVLVGKTDADGTYWKYTAGFQIFKLNGSKWIKLRCLSDYALFLGRNSSLCLTPSDCRQFKANHVYFTDYHEQHFELQDKPDMGVFNIEESSIQALVQEKYYYMEINLIWVQPTLNMRCLGPANI